MHNRNNHPAKLQMRNLIFILLLGLPLIPAIAQGRFGITGGVNLGDISLKWDNVCAPYIYPRFGCSLGIGSELKISGDFSLLTDFNLISKNYSIDQHFYGDSIEGYDRYSVLYLDMPLRLSYSHNNMRIFAGPFLDYCLSGTNKYNLISPDSTQKEGNNKLVVTRYFSSHYIEKENLAVYYLDGGVQFGIGYQCKDYCLDLCYSWGLINVYPDTKRIHGRNEMKSHTRLLILNVFFYL
jgi:hypothetical protein